MMTICGDLTMLHKSTHEWLHKVKQWARENKPAQDKPKLSRKK